MLGTVLGISVLLIVTHLAAAFGGVLFNTPIRAVLQKIPLVGKYF